MSKPFDSVLYFPSIEFQSDEWVKSSLLFWDKIYRIVPPDYAPNDSETVLEATRHSLIKNILLDKTYNFHEDDLFVRLLAISFGW